MGNGIVDFWGKVDTEIVCAVICRLNRGRVTVFD